MRHPVPLLLLSLISLLWFVGCTERGERFPVETYLRSANNLQGNRYTLDAEIDAQLSWNEGTGRLIAVRPLNSATSGQGNITHRLPVYIADSLQANLMVAQRYRFEITVQKGGLLNVTSLKKL